MTISAVLLAGGASRRMGEDKATKLLREIVVKNGISVRKGHTLMANMVVSGEVPIALTIYHHEVEPMKRAGAPIAELDIAPEIAFVTGAAVAKRAPHPYAAVLFLDYLLTDGQREQMIAFNSRQCRRDSAQRSARRLSVEH